MESPSNQLINQRSGKDRRTGRRRTEKKYFTKAIQPTMEMLEDMQALKKCLKAYAKGEWDGGKHAKLILNELKPKVAGVEGRLKGERVYTG